MLLRLAYLAVTNGLAMLRLLPTSDRTKDVEILALRHQIAVLERQLHGHGHRVRFAPADRALLAALLHRLPRQTLHQIRLVRPISVPSAAIVLTLAANSERSVPPDVAAWQSGEPGSAEAGLYATSIKKLSEEVRAEGPNVGVLYIIDHTCAEVVVRVVQDGCEARPLSSSLRDELAAALAGYSPVRYVSNGQEVTDASMNVIDGGAVVALGPIKMTTGHAELSLAIRRNGLNAQALTYVLKYNGDTWQIVGTTGPRLMS